MARLPAALAFSARLSAVMALLAGFVLLQGAVNGWISGMAAQRVLQGRIAADLHAGFIDLSATKQGLRAWSLQVLLGTAPVANEGGRLSRRLVDAVARLRELGRQAEALELGGAGPAREAGDGHRRREADLALLAEAFAALREAVLGLDAISPVSDPLAAWGKLERTFDVAGDRQLNSLLQEMIARETEQLAQKRAATDLSLSRLRAVSTGATLTILGVALLLALLLTRALRRPLQDMTAGAAALRAGDLAHRIPVRADDEFGRLAASVNAMATELLARRREEVRRREDLQDQVDIQTRHLHEALAGLQLSETRRRQLIADISHELRTPTTAIRGEAEIALRGQPRDAEAYRDTLLRITDAAIHLGTVIDDLLTVARSDADALAVQPTRIEFGAVVAGAVAQARPAAEMRGLALAFAPAPGPLPMLADAQRLHQLVGLLLDNAIRYSHPGGRVEVAVGPAGTAPDGPGLAVLTIRDQGIGIPPNEIERVFERQHRAANARRHRPDGTGLGLAIARDLARRHQGEVTLEALETGTRATVRLPLAAPDMAPDMADGDHP
jgi:signal transduction histidine kinase